VNRAIEYLRGSRPARLILIAVAAVGIILLLAWAFEESRKEAALEAERERPVPIPLRATYENGRPIVRVDAATQRRNGIIVTPVEAASAVAPIRAFARVVDVARLTDLNNNYETSRASVAAAEAKAAASRAAAERARLLYRDAQNFSLAQLQSAEATWRADEAAAASARAQLDANTALIRQEFGMAFRPGATLVASLAQRRSVLIQVTAPPGVAGVSAPSAVQLESDTGVRTSARLVSAAAQVDPRIQGYSFYYVAAASSGLLPGMNLLALLPGSRTVSGALVPETTIVSWQGRSWLYRLVGPEAFERIEVPSELQASEGGSIVPGLAAGTRVVTQGAQLLLSEEMRSQIQVGENKE